MGKIETSCCTMIVVEIQWRCQQIILWSLYVLTDLQQKFSFRYLGLHSSCRFSVDIIQGDWSDSLPVRQGDCGEREEYEAGLERGGGGDLGPVMLRMWKPVLLWLIACLVPKYKTVFSNLMRTCRDKCLILQKKYELIMNDSKFWRLSSTHKCIGVPTFCSESLIRCHPHY